MDLARVYEINLLLSPNLSEAEVNDLVKDYKSICENFGVVADGDTVQKIELAYPVKNKRLVWWVNFLHISLTGDFQSKLLDQFRLREEVLRWMIIKLKKDEQRRYQGLEELKQKALQRCEQQVLAG